MRLPPETQEVSLSIADTVLRVNCFERRCRVGGWLCGPVSSHSPAGPLFMCNERCLRVRNSRFDVGGAGIASYGFPHILRYPAPLWISPFLRPHPYSRSEA